MPLQQRCIAARGHQQQITEFARRAVPSGRPGDVINDRSHLDVRVGRRRREAGSGEQGQVGPVVANDRDLGPFQTQQRPDGFAGAELVVCPIDRVRYAKVGAR